jgi:hypothetical protein
VVEGIIAGEEVTGFGEENDDESHDDADGSAVDFCGVDVSAVGLEGIAVCLDEEFDGFADSFAECGGEFGLPFAAVEDGGEEWRVLGGCSGGPCLG